MQSNSLYLQPQKQIQLSANSTLTTFGIPDTGIIISVINVLQAEGLRTSVFYIPPQVTETERIRQVGNQHYQQFLNSVAIQPTYQPQPQQTFEQRAPQKETTRNKLYQKKKKDNFISKPVNIPAIFDLSPTTTQEDLNGSEYQSIIDHLNTIAN